MRPETRDTRHETRDDEMTRWRETDERTRWRDDEMMRDREDEKTRRRDDETTRRQDDKMTRLQDDERPSGRDDETTRRRDDKMTRWRVDDFSRAACSISWSMQFCRHVITFVAIIITRMIQLKQRIQWLSRTFKHSSIRRYVRIIAHCVCATLP